MLTRGIAALAAMAVTLLAGCSDDAAPSPSPTTSASLPSAAAPDDTDPSAEPSPTRVPISEPPPSPTPPDMSHVDAATAEAVARYFMDLHSYAWLTGDVSGWDALSDPQCAFCTQTRDAITDLYSRGLFTIDGDLSYPEVWSEEISPGFWNVHMVVVAAPSAVLDAEGTVVSRKDEARTHDTVLSITYTGTQWMVVSGSSMPRQ